MLHRMKDDLPAALVLFFLGSVGLWQAGTWDQNVWRFPIVVCWAMLGLGVMLVAKPFVRAAAAEVLDRPDDGDTVAPADASTDARTDGDRESDTRLQAAGVKRRMRTDVAVVAVAALAVLWALPRLGFVVTAGLLVGGTMAYLTGSELRRSWWVVGLTTIAAVTAVYYLFGGLLNVPLHRGTYWR